MYHKNSPISRFALVMGRWSGRID